MATIETICKFNQTGFCKFVSHCRNQHIMDICPNKKCSIKTCVFMHPKICKYFFNFEMCKFDVKCAYIHHASKENLDTQIDDLESKMKKIEAKIDVIDSLQLRLELQETKLKTLEHLDTKLKARDLNVDENKIDELQKNLKDLSDNFYILIHAVDDLERSSKKHKLQLEELSEQLPKWKCNLCGKFFQDELNMSEHIRRQHRTFKT